METTTASPASQLVPTRHATLAPLAARRTGQPQRTIEPGSRHSATRGHSATEPGLRGHSVDEATFPWRIVGGYYYTPVANQRSDKWSVVGANGITIASRIEAAGTSGTIYATSDEACDRAHQLARALKRQYPEGYVPEGRNLGGTVETLAERLAGCVIQVDDRTQPGHSFQYFIEEKPRGWRTLFGRRLDDHRTLCAFDAWALSTSPYLNVAVVSLPDRYRQGDDYLTGIERHEVHYLAHKANTKT